jgi:hypothetical protein
MTIFSVQEAITGERRTQMRPFVQEGGVHLPRSFIDELFLMKRKKL